MANATHARSSFQILDFFRSKISRSIIETNNQIEGKYNDFRNFSNEQADNVTNSKLKLEMCLKRTNSN